MNPYLARLKDLLAEKQVTKGPPKPPNGPYGGYVGAQGRGFAATRLGFEESGVGPFVHCCGVCGVWGAFGFGVNLRAGRLGQWYCFGHRPNYLQAVKGKDLEGRAA
jgi:hypothetical protein